MTNRFVSYRLEFRDGSIDVDLSYVHRSYLCYLAEKGGEARLNYASLEHSQEEHIRQLVIPFRCLSEVPIVGDGRSVVHRLTEVGANIVTAIRNNGGP